MLRAQKYFLHQDLSYLGEFTHLNNTEKRHNEENRPNSSSQPENLSGKPKEPILEHFLALDFVELQKHPEIFGSVPLGDPNSQSSDFYAAFPPAIDDALMGSLFKKRLSFSDISKGPPASSPPLEVDLLRPEIFETLAGRKMPLYVQTASTLTSTHQTVSASPQSLLNNTSNCTPPSGCFSNALTNTTLPARIIQKAPKTIAKDKSPPAETPNRDSLKDPVQLYITLIPLINTVNPFNFGTLLTAALRECLDQVPIDEFYNFLFNADDPDHVTVTPVDGTKIHKAEATKLTPYALKFCHFVLETFRPPDSRVGSFTAGLVNNFLLLSMNVKEILRVFLAIKVIFDSVETVDSSLPMPPKLARQLIYQAYYIICQKLSYKYPCRSVNLPVVENLVLGQSRFGKLIKLIYPDLATKRLGRRGQSRYHYLGVKWNDKLMDNDMKRMAELEFSQIEKELHSAHGKKNVKRDPPLAMVSVGTELNLHSRSKRSELLQPALATTKTSQYSFVNASSKFPKCDCSPRVWQTTPGEIPKQSRWSKARVQHSVEVLKSRKIDVEPLLEAFNLSADSADFSSGFFEVFVQMMHQLLDLPIPPSDDAYLHLYLIVILLLSPLILDSSQEGPLDTKAKLRCSLNNFVIRLQGDFETLATKDSNNLLNFIKVLKRMVHMNKLFLTRVELSLAKRTLKELVADMYQMAEIQLDLSGDKTILGEIVIRAVIMAVNAFDCKIVSEELETGGPLDYNGVILKLAMAFMNLAIIVTEKSLQLEEAIDLKSSETKTFDLPFRIFNNLSDAFHEIFLSDPLVLQLPIQVISFVLLQITNEMQKVSFHEFSKREPELSRETFKVWWVYSMTVQEYNGLISEIVALSGRLS